MNVSPDIAGPSTAETDQSLARRVQAGDGRAFAELDRRYRARLLLLMRRRVGCVHDAEDLTQQALGRAYERIGQYDATRPFAPWLFTLAVRVSIDLLRSPDRRVVREPWRDDTAAAGVNPPLAAAQAAERRSVLWSIADDVLDARQRTLLWLHYVEQLTPGEIGKAMSMSAVHVRVSLHRARKALAPHVAHLHESADEAAANDARPALALATGDENGDV